MSRTPTSPDHHSVAHAFTNAILHLDYQRKGFDHPTLCFPLNCYGRLVVSCRGFMTRMDRAVDFDPPSPSPRRFMDLGAATAQALKDSPYRVALLASASWSHAFLVDHTWRLRPDTEKDRRLYDAMTDRPRRTTPVVVGLIGACLVAARLALLDAEGRLRAPGTGPGERAGCGDRPLRARPECHRRAADHRASGRPDQLAA